MSSTKPILQTATVGEVSYLEVRFSEIVCVIFKLATGRFRLTETKVESGNSGKREECARKQREI